MIVISNLSESYIQEVATPEMTAVIGGSGGGGFFFPSYSYTQKVANVNLTQVAISGGGFFSGAVNYANVGISQ
jgi:hypothetical protein